MKQGKKVKFCSSIDLILFAFLNRRIFDHRLDCNKSYCYTMYLPTQIRFPIGGECVTCHGSKLINSLGRTKLTNSLGKQQIEVWTRTWSGRDPWNRNKFASQPASSKHLSLQFFVNFWVGRYNKTPNDWSCRKQWVLFPSWPQSSLKGLKETKLTISVRASH